MRINEMIANLRCFDCEKKLSSSVPKEMLKKIWRIWILMLGWIRFNAELRMNYSAHKYSDCLVNEQSRRRVAVIPNPPPPTFSCALFPLPPPLSRVRCQWTPFLRFSSLGLSGLSRLPIYNRDNPDALIQCILAVKLNKGIGALSEEIFWLTYFDFFSWDIWIAVKMSNLEE